MQAPPSPPHCEAEPLSWQLPVLSQQPAAQLDGVHFFTGVPQETLIDADRPSTAPTTIHRSAFMP